MALAEAIPGRYPIPIAPFSHRFAPFLHPFAPFRTVPNRFPTVSSAERCENCAKRHENDAKRPKMIQNGAIGIGYRPGMASASAIESLLGDVWPVFY